MTSTPMTAYLSLIAEVVTKIVAWLGEVLDLVETEPVLVFTVGFLAIGGTIGIVSRLIRQG